MKTHFFVQGLQNGVDFGQIVFVMYDLDKKWAILLQIGNNILNMGLNKMSF